MNSQRTRSAQARGGLRNPAYLHPDDLAALGLGDGDRIVIDDGRCQVEAVAAADETLRPGIVSSAHCRGILPGGGKSYDAVGFSTRLFVRTDSEVEGTNAMPAMTSILVRVRALNLAS